MVTIDQVLASTAGVLDQSAAGAIVDEGRPKGSREVKTILKVPA